MKKLLYIVKVHELPLISFGIQANEPMAAMETFRQITGYKGGIFAERYDSGDKWPDNFIMLQPTKNPGL